MVGELTIGVLGPLEVKRDGTPLPIAAPKQRALVAMLALDVGRVVSTDVLVDRLWAGRPPATAVATLQVYVSQLRKHVGRDVLGTRSPGYALSLSPERVDVVRFERLVAEGRSLLQAGDLNHAHTTLVEALGLWRGEVLAEFVYEEWAAAPIRQLDEQRLVALEDRIDAELRMGRGGDLTGELERLVHAYPLRERLRAHHMLALYRAGRQADALAAYQQAREALVEELGIDPSPALVELERRILQQDDSLLPSRPTAPERDHAKRVAPTDPSPSAPASVTSRAPCAQCGVGLSPDARFCPACGAAVKGEGEAEERQQRKLVTVLFCDVVASTALAERLDAEVLREVMKRYFDAASAVVSRHGGSVEKFIGDAVVALFGVPKVHEDDALRAARAAYEIQTVVGAISGPVEVRWGVRLQTRIGVNTGEVVVADRGKSIGVATGDAVNVAERLEAAAAAGEILIGEATMQLVAGRAEVAAIAPLAVKGKAEPVAAYRLVGVEDVTAWAVRPARTPLVGRERELAQISAGYEHAREAAGCVMFTLLGEPGVGKTRLVTEVLTGLAGDPVVLGGRCLPYGTSSAYWPLVDVVRAAGAITIGDSDAEAGGKLAAALGSTGDCEEVARTLASLVGSDPAAAAVDGEALAWAIRRLLESVAERRPLIVTLDDVQWGDDVLLELLEGLSDWDFTRPLLLLLIARPDLLERRPVWGGGKLNSHTLLLEPLPATETRALISELSSAGFSDAAAERILERSQGNPLFVEELLAMLDAQRRSAGAEIGEIPDTVVEALPLTLSALLSARLDQLAEPERRLLCQAAIVGEGFDLHAVGAVSGHELGELRQLAGHLLHSQYLRRDVGAGSEDAYRFRHILVRDAAYEATSKADRALWHGRFADWLEVRAEPSEVDTTALLAHHLERAYAYRSELGHDGEDVWALAVRAAEAYESLAERATDLLSSRSAARLFATAEKLRPTNDPRRAVLASQRAYHLYLVCEMRGVEQAAAAARTVANQTGDPTAAGRAAIAEALVGLQSPNFDATTVEAALRELAERSERRGDFGTAAYAWTAVAQIDWHRGAIASTIAAIRRTVQLVHEQAIRPLAFSEGHLAMLLTMGIPTTLADAECEVVKLRAAAEARGDRTILTSMTFAQSRVACWRDEYDRALELIREGADVARKVARPEADDTNYWYTYLYLWHRRYAEAERLFRRQYETDLKEGAITDAATSAACLAQALIGLRRLDEAHELIAFSRANAAPTDVFNWLFCEPAAAHLAALANDPTEVDASVLRALAACETTDLRPVRLLAKVQCAEALVLVGEHELALRMSEDALAEASAAGLKLIVRYATDVRELVVPTPAR